MESRKEHWEKVYRTTAAEKRSWTQTTPQTSLDFIHSVDLPKSASIIDIGSGDSMLVDHLLDEGFTNITALDISETALQRTKERLGKRSSHVEWIISDILNFQPSTSYDLWHDRATFHFLTTTEEVDRYLSIARAAIKEYLLIGTFSDKGPKRCSGLSVHQYSEEMLQQEVARDFEKIRCITDDHRTPFGTLQNFLFCSFKKR